MLDQCKGENPGNSTIRKDYPRQPEATGKGKMAVTVRKYENAHR
jgi:hypothetical protein